MRDKKRIKPIMAELTKIWNAVPDERFWQFLMNLSQRLEVDRDPFYLEDDVALSQLKALSSKWGLPE